LGPGPLRVVGLRSIGTTLAAIVAAATGAPDPVTLRPVGHPFGRELSLDPALERALASEPEIPRAIVDEGPGLSGSTMACVAEHLLREGVSPAAIQLFPGHGNGPGPEASEPVRALWQRLPTHVVEFDRLVREPADPRHRLEHWVEDLVGEPRAPLEDISGGAWRTRRYASEAERPPVLAWQEKRKFLLRTASGDWLLKFVGLGRIGRDKHELARRLSEAGFTPTVAGFRHGFLVERWREDATPLAAADRPALLRRLGAYLGFRARECGCEPGRGASLASLFEMARVNVGEALGPDAARTLTAGLPDPESLQRQVRPVLTDNRLHAWEWIVTPDALLKTDALDHHQGHDLVGAQDIHWDLAGAAVEFSLDGAELADLFAALEREAGAPVHPRLLRAYLPCYAAFQLGYYTMAANGTPDGPERERLRSAATRYRKVLVRPGAERGC
jgi:hypothetical protein